MPHNLDERVTLISSVMETYIRDYQRSTAHIAALAAESRFPSKFESDVFYETLNRAKGAAEVLQIVANGVDDELVVKLKNFLIRHITRKSIVNSQFLLPIQESILIMESETLI